MAVSRIVFALGDLTTEIKRLAPPDSEVSAAVCLDTENYERVRDEVVHHYGAPVKIHHSPVAVDPHGPYLEHFVLAGLKIGRIVSKHG